MTEPPKVSILLTGGTVTHRFDPPAKAVGYGHQYAVAPPSDFTAETVRVIVAPSKLSYAVSVCVGEQKYPAIAAEAFSEVGSISFEIRPGEAVAVLVTPDHALEDFKRKLNRA